MNVTKDLLKSEMVAVKNCILQSTDKQNITFNGMKKILSKNVFPNLYKLFQVTLTMPVSSCTRERSFSVMRRIKTLL